MKNKLWLTTFREIKESLGRYLAILAIVAIGVGFFAGLKVTDPALRESMNIYFKDNSFYDYRMISTLGFEAEDVDEVKELDNVRAAEGSCYFDIILEDEDENTDIFRFQTITEDVNTITLVAGRLPESANEFVGDNYLFSEEDVGKTFFVSSSNESEDSEKFSVSELTMVGIAKSPLYIQYERGSTSLGNGVIDGFAYVNSDTFDVDYFTEIYVKLDSDEMIYSDEYEAVIDSTEDYFEENLDIIANERYSRIYDEANEKLSDAEATLEDEKADALSDLEEAKNTLDEAQEELTQAKESLDDNEALLATTKENLDSLKAQIDQIASVKESTPWLLDATTLASYEVMLTQYGEGTAAYETGMASLEAGKKEYEEGLAEYEEGLADYEEGLAEYNEKIADAEEKIADAKADLAELEEPETYLLTRDSNVGYACFESDSNIVSGISGVFPIFFFLVAALVCMTTMSRMVEDQRTGIGVLKALGYDNGSILMKFSFYSGTAALSGALIGFIFGTIIFPKAIWYAYQMMYDTRDVDYYFSLSALIISIVVALICSVGVTFVACNVELFEMAASLMRPKAPKAGKRILLERIPFIWNRLKFLMKVTLRNIFRYKGRLFMMILGIGGCTALLATGFGIYDSIADICENQYENISLYDVAITLKNPTENNVEALDELGYAREDYYIYYETSVDVITKKGTKNIYMDVLDGDYDIDNFYSLHTISYDKLELPGLGQAIINKRIADTYDLKVGDTINLYSEDTGKFEVEIAGINQNFIYNFVYITKETYESKTGLSYEPKSVYLNLNGEDAHEALANIMEKEGITSVVASVDMLERVNNMMESLNIIVLLVLASAAALAFVVVYNLTNINIAERVREIATIKVLGFYKGETCAYVFRENIILSAIGGFIGLFLGKLLHTFVMSKIVVDLITFDVRINALSYLYSFLLTVGFTFIVNLAMNKKLDEISMTESLKAVE